MADTGDLEQDGVFKNRGASLSAVKVSDFM